MNHQAVSHVINERTLTIETGEIAKQANGSAVVRYGDTMVFAAATAAPEERGGLDFFPLTVDYREKTYAAGKIPGGFIKREGRPSEKETLTSRIIDRPIRPLFADGYGKETQVLCMVLSVDQQNDPDIVAVIAASAALTVSDIPFLGPIGAVRMGYVDDRLVVNPTSKELEKSLLNMVVAGTRDAIVMVEGGADELPEVDYPCCLRNCPPGLAALYRSATASATYGREGQDACHCSCARCRPGTPGTQYGL